MKVPNGRRPFARLLAALALATLPALPAAASGLSVTPTQIDFRPGDSVQGLRLDNTGTAPLRAQVRVFAWSQPDGADALDASRELMISPPMFSIEPGQHQLVRVVRPGGNTDDGVERSYRLLIDELPDPNASHKTALNFVLRYSVPVFVGHASDAPALQWRLDAGPAPRLRTANRGSGHAQIAGLALLDAGGRVVYERDGLVGYVLPGVEIHWPFALPAAAAQAVAIQARINGQTVRQALAADRGPR